MNPDLEKNLVRLRKLSNDLSKNKLSDVEREWLASALRKIYEGADPIEVLGIQAGKGQRRENVDKNHDIDLAMHLVAGLNDKELGGEKTLKESIEFVAKLYGFEIETLTRYWNDKNKKTMQSVIRDDTTYD
jgi:hypothetical protein